MAPPAALWGYVGGAYRVVTLRSNIDVAVGLLGGKGITLPYISSREPSFKPLHALLRGAVGEGLRRDRAPRTTLQVIVPNLCGGLEGGGDILLIDEPPFRRVMSPYPGKTIRLQLQPDGELVGGRLRRPGLHVMDFLQGP